MAKYTNDARLLVDYVGGIENIAAVTHCLTRMRFVLHKANLVATDKIEDLDSVKGTFTRAGQFQIIIGPDVAEFFQAFAQCTHLPNATPEKLKEAIIASERERKNEKSFLQRIIGILGDIFAPVIPALIVGGITLGLQNLIGVIKFFDGGSKSLAEISLIFHGLNQLLVLIGNIIFPALPVFICWSICRRMGASQVLGIVLGLSLVYSGFIPVSDIANIPIDKVSSWDFGYFKVYNYSYQGQVVAAMLAGFVLVSLERFFRSITPTLIAMIVVPVASLIPAILIAQAIAGPVGLAVGNWLADIILAGFASDYKILVAGIFGFVFVPVQLTGLHQIATAIDLTLVSTKGGTPIWPLLALSSICQASAILAMTILQRKNVKASQINIPATISCYIAVSEPAIFGVNLKYVFPMVAGMIGTSIACMISIGGGVEALSIGVAGILGVISIKPQFLLTWIIAGLIGAAISFTLTYLIGLKKLTSYDLTGIQSKNNEEELTENASEPNENMDKQENNDNPHSENDEEDIDIASIYAEVEENFLKEEQNLPPAEHKMTAPAEQYCQYPFLSPAAGWVIPLGAVRDEGFAGGYMGEGFAIIPTERFVVAPFDAEVIATYPTKHAYTLRGKDGVEVLIHIGLDTVILDGRGFDCFVEQGDQVKAGDKLCRVDFDLLKEHNLSTVIAIVFPNNEHIWLQPDLQQVTLGQANILQLAKQDEAKAPKKIEIITNKEVILDKRRQQEQHKRQMIDERVKQKVQKVREQKRREKQNT
ncbi:PTS trehalose transporter subunit IIBC [Volucribacter amazonae]|uniref:Uncharacterized protein n=1 Tax=Volucribacter amazonae TaxID=256731 RepID=A0A9X4SLQ3_9PAST|nr:PTS trehalose transporter subunit IIBC [Volucribacter amazonae]MDG6895288.1 hypothetical protein [Volucribacter amazonae]